MRNSPFSIPFLAIIVLFTGCKTSYQSSSVQYLTYRISTTQSSDSSLTSLLRPYSDSVNKTMSDVIAIAGMSLEKKQPEGTLNNVLADAMLYEGREKYNTHIDAAFVNYGGIRLNTLSAGNITRGKIFEVAPFDNIIVLLKLNTDIFQQFLDLTAARGGWPCAGISYQVKGKKAINVLVNGKALEKGGTYTVALLDYVANGGDDCVMLKSLPQQNNGSLFRDAVISYFSKINQQGKQVKAQIENRVTNAE